MRTHRVLPGRPGERGRRGTLPSALCLGGEPGLGVWGEREERHGGKQGRWAGPQQAGFQGHHIPWLCIAFLICKTMSSDEVLCGAPSGSSILDFTGREGRRWRGAEGSWAMEGQLFLALKKRVEVQMSPLTSGFPSPIALAFTSSAAVAGAFGVWDLIPSPLPYH